VKILIDISPEHYDRLLSEFTEESHIYAILKNGASVVTSKPANGGQVKTGQWIEPETRFFYLFTS
jgi:hypothetical protein